MSKSYMSGQITPSLWKGKGLNNALSLHLAFSLMPASTFYQVINPRQSTITSNHVIIQVPSTHIIREFDTSGRLPSFSLKTDFDHEGNEYLSLLGHGISVNRIAFQVPEVSRKFLATLFGEFVMLMIEPHREKRVWQYRQGPGHIP